MKLSIKFVSRSDCYVSLPQKYLNSYPIEFDYKQNKICDVVECKLSNGKKNYFGFHGATSQNESSLEISEAFAVALGIPENEYVDVRPFQGATLAKSIDIYCRNSIDYQLVAQNRGSIESKLLNQIAVVFPNICFPISYNQNDQVILTYREQNILLLGENTDLNILCDATVADPMTTSNVKIIPSLTVQIQSLENQIHRPIDLQNYLYINWAVAQKFQIKENEPYLLELQFPKLVRLAANYQKFCIRYRQIQYQMPDSENVNFNKPKKFPVLIRFKDNLPNDFELETTLGHPNVFAPKLMIQSLKMSESQLAKISALEDFKNNRVLFLDETMKLAKYKILIRLLANPYNTQSKVLGDCRKQLFASIMDEQQKDAVLYDQQLIFLSDALMRLRIFEKSPDGLLKEIKLLHLRINPEKLKAKRAEIEKALNEVLTYDLGDNNKLDQIRPGRSKEIMDIYDEKLKASSKKKVPFIYKGFHQKELVELRCALKEGCSQFLMLKGLAGSGKSTIVDRLFQIEETHFFSKARIQFKELMSPKNPEEAASLLLIRKYLKLNFELAILNQPSILVLEDVDVICKHKDRIDPMNPEEGILADTTSALLKDLMKEILELDHNICVYMLITTRGGDFLSEEFGKVKKKEIAIEKITTEAKAGFLASELEQFGTHIKDEQLKMLEMFNLQNLVVLREKLSRELELYQKEEVTPKKADSIFQSHLDAICSSMSTVSSISTTFKDVGGLEEVKQVILDTFQAPLKYSLIFKNVSIKLPRGILLFGPSGCGKTLIAAAAANELGLNFLSVKGPELLNKYIGASEQAVRDIFEKASARSPCIIFFDEFDSIVPKRNSGSTGVTDRVVNQFLCYLDGASEIKDIFILAATSRPDLIDPALLRPGRIDKHVFLDYPGEKERYEILQIYMQGTASEGLDLAEYATKTEGYSGADLSALVKNAQIKALHVILETENKEKLKKGELNLVITKEIFDKCLQELKKSSNRDIEQTKMRRVYEDFIGKKNLDISKQKTTLY